MQNEPEGDAPSKATRDWRWALGVIGKVFISLGLLILAFVAYQLWGTGIEFRANQDDLAKEFREAVASVTDPSTPTVATDPAATPDTAPTPGGAVSPTTAAASTTTTDPLARLETGDLLAAIKMPTISDTTFYVVAGVGYGDLKRGIGHYPGTSLPGQFGNAALAGHRTTYGAPFEDLDRLQEGDPIVIDTVNGGHYEYLVERQEIINPDRIEVLAPPKDPEAVLLTLTTCHPKRSVAQRLIIHARLNPETSSAVAKRSKTYSKKRPAPPAVVTSTTPAPTTSAVVTTAPTITSATSSVGVTDTVPVTDPVTTEPEPDETVADALVGEDVVGGGDDEVLASGWFDDTGAWPHIILWGLLLSAIAFGIHFGGRRIGRRWLGIAVGAAPFLVVLYFFFQNVNRLLPPGL